MKEAPDWLFWLLVIIAIAACSPLPELIGYWLGHYK